MDQPQVVLDRDDRDGDGGIATAEGIAGFGPGVIRDAEAVGGELRGVDDVGPVGLWLVQPVADAVRQDFPERIDRDPGRLGRRFRWSAGGAGSGYLFPFPARPAVYGLP